MSLVQVPSKIKKNCHIVLISSDLDRFKTNELGRALDQMPYLVKYRYPFIRCTEELLIMYLLPSLYTYAQDFGLIFYHNPKATRRQYLVLCPDPKHGLYSLIQIISLTGYWPFPVMDITWLRMSADYENQKKNYPLLTLLALSLIASSSNYQIWSIKQRLWLS